MGVNSRLVKDGADTAGARITPVLDGTPSPDAVGLTDGNGNVAKWTDNADGTATLNTNAAIVGSVATAPAAPTAANVLNGFQSSTASTVATTLITVPAGRTWVGTVGVSAACTVVAASATAGQARGVVTIAGVGATPAAGSVMACEAKAGANAATGTVGVAADNNSSMPLTVIAPGGNAVTVQITTTIAGTAGVVDSWASGALQ